MKKTSVKDKKTDYYQSSLKWTLSHYFYYSCSYLSKFWEVFKRIKKN